MKTIYKYTIPLTAKSGIVNLEMPINAQFLCVREQDKKICLWYLVNEGPKKELRTFYVGETGQEFEIEHNHTYLGTCQIGWWVAHVFEVFAEND